VVASEARLAVDPSATRSRLGSASTLTAIGSSRLRRDGRTFGGRVDLSLPVRDGAPAVGIDQAGDAVAVSEQDDHRRNIVSIH
jgi:hypothetical protein